VREENSVKLLVIGNVGFDLMVPYLRSKRIETVVADATEDGLNVELADTAYSLDPEGWEPLAEVALRERVDAVISISGPDHRNLRDSKLKEFLESEYAIPTLANPARAAAIAVDKWQTKKWLKANGFPVTVGEVAHCRAEAKTIARRLGFPAVIKNLADSGGVGMQIIDSEVELEREADEYPVLIERFTPGAEFSVEVLNFEGRALSLTPVYKGLTDREAIHPMERVRLAPAPLDATDAARLRNLAKSIVTGLDLQPTADIDIVWSEDGPKILEINPRFGGVTALSIAASGVMAYWVLVDMITGSWDPARYRFNRAFAADLPIGPGANYTPLEDLLATDGVFRIKLQKLKRTIGRIALTADDPQRLLDIARLATCSRVCEEANLQELRDLVELAAIP